MEAGKRNHSIRVGLFVFAGIALVFSGVLMIGNLHETFTRKVSVVALFDDVSGLQPGNNVWFSGVKIGVVSRIRFRSDNKVGVTIKIDQKAQEFIRKDSKVKLSTDGLIGNRILIIYGGSKAASEAGAGDTLMVEKTLSQSDVLNVLQESNRNILSITENLKKISDDLSHGKGTIGKLLKDTLLFENLNNATGSIAGAGIEGKETLRLIRDYVKLMDKQGTFMNELATDTVVFNELRKVAVKMDKVSSSANRLISRLDSITRNDSPVGILLGDSTEGSRIRATLKNLQESSSLLEEDLRAMQHSILLRRYFKKNNRKK